MKPILILDSDGTLKYVAEWPEDHPLMSGQEPFDSILKEARKQAIANGIPFKSKKDEEKVRALLKQCYGKFGDCPDADCEITGCKHYRDCLALELEKFKPSAVPENLKIEIIEQIDYPNSPDMKPFAFIVRHPKEETLKDELDLILSHTEKPQKEEDQDELWGEVFRNLKMTTRWDLIKAKFRIERIK